MEPDEEEVTPDRYQAHLATIAGKMTESVRRLASGLNLHDGLLQRLRVDQHARTLSILLRCGDRQVGHFDLELAYSGVSIEKLDLSLLREIACDRHTELLYDEVELSARGYTHSILFWPYRELAIEFEALSLREEPQKERAIRIPPAKRFIAVGASAG